MKNTKWEGKAKQRAWTLLAFKLLQKGSSPRIGSRGVFIWT